MFRDAFEKYGAQHFQKDTKGGHGDAFHDEWHGDDGKVPS